MDENGKCNLTSSLKPTRNRAAYRRRYMYKKSAIISECGKYRYELRRIWQSKTGLVCWVMLNPSTADANFDDPTIRRCMGYAARWGYGGIIVVNLFGLRATNPKELYKVDDPIGPKNSNYISRASWQSNMTIAAWGTKGTYLSQNLAIIKKTTNLYCLALTKNGHPKHPLYLTRDLEPKPYNQATPPDGKPLVSSGVRLL